MLRNIIIIVLIISLCALSAVSLGEFYFSVQSDNPEYYLFIISIFSFCIGSYIFWVQLYKNK